MVLVSTLKSCMHEAMAEIKLRAIDGLRGAPVRADRAYSSSGENCIS